MVFSKFSALAENKGCYTESSVVYPSHRDIRGRQVWEYPTQATTPTQGNSPK